MSNYPSRSRHNRLLQRTLAPILVAAGLLVSACGEGGATDTARAESVATTSTIPAADAPETTMARETTTSVADAPETTSETTLDPNAPETSLPTVAEIQKGEELAPVTGDIETDAEAIQLVETLAKRIGAAINANNIEALGWYISPEKLPIFWRGLVESAAYADGFSDYKLGFKIDVVSNASSYRTKDLIYMPTVTRISNDGKLGTWVCDKKPTNLELGLREVAYLDSEGNSKYELAWSIIATHPLDPETKLIDNIATC